MGGSPMQIYVDADACPNVIKKILYKSANRLKMPVILVANRYLSTPQSRYIKSIRVDAGMDVADEKIVEMLEKGDLVITADIPLANNVIEKGGFALNPRGELYTKENIRHHSYKQLARRIFNSLKLKNIYFVGNLKIISDFNGLYLMRSV
jgi:hypothetical protein